VDFCTVPLIAAVTSSPRPPPPATVPSLTLTSFPPSPVRTCSSPVGRALSLVLKR
ncbi:uncharacterized protein DAT39_021822, partial [Clarias magur]